MRHGRRSRALATLACALTLAGTGCAALRQNPTTCKVAGGLIGGTLGAVGGGVGASQIDGAPDNVEIATSAAIGWLVGGAIGLGIGHFACRAEEAPSVSGRDEAAPVASNETEEGRAPNPRVELRPTE